MLTSAIISKFELYLDDTTELSSQEELDLANKVYKKVCGEHPWEFLKTAGSGTTSITLPYVALATDFNFLIPNYDFTGFTSSHGSDQAEKVVFVGTTYTPYRVVNFSDRRQYRDQDGYCYLDMVNSRLYFTKQPTTAQTIEYDYIKEPADLTLITSPLIPERFQHIIYHGMAVDDYIIQQFDKARSYKQENEGKYLEYLADMTLWNARLSNN